jgi:hypothetical protein
MSTCRSRLLSAFPHCPPYNPVTSVLDDETIMSIKLQMRTCTSHAEDIVHIFRDWIPEYFSTVNPETSSSIWIAGVVLIMQIIISGEMDSRERSRLLSSLDILTLSLEQFARWWQVCRAMLGQYIITKRNRDVTDCSTLDSLEVLRQQAFSVHDFCDVYQLLSIVEGPFNPRRNKFLKRSDYQINRSGQTHSIQPQDSFFWGLPPQDLESFLSETGWSNSI